MGEATSDNTNQDRHETAGLTQAPVELTEFEIHNQAIDIMSLPIYTRSQLAKYNGVDDTNIYVAIRGYIYDVTANSSSYGPGKGYHRLTGKDVSRMLGLNQLKLADSEVSTWYTGDLNEKQNAIVDKWVLFFKKRYNIVGMVVDHSS